MGYTRFEVAFSPDSGEDRPIVTGDYREAFAAYQKTPHKATLYGVDEQDGYTCILSK